MYRLSRRYRLSLLICCSLFFLLGFLFPENVYRFPLDNHSTLSGTFGELRPNHFHSGIDIKTGGKIGAPIYAIQEGYVYRIKVSPYGFGKAIYLRHPDGRFSVYGHMNRFNPEISARISAEQRSTRTYDQELYLPKDEMVVGRGELLGYSGNSGSSFGPHLHFEIRDPEEQIMNPLDYYQGKVVDNIKPTVQEIGFEPIDPDSRLRGEFRKLILPPSGSNGKYTINTLIKVKGRFGIEYRGFDLLNGAGNHCGINHVKLYLDEELVYTFDLDLFSFDESRYINEHIDFAYYKQTNKRFEKAYQDFGNQFSAFGESVNRGLLEVKDADIHNFRLELSDGYGNTSTVSGRLQQDMSDPFAVRPPQSNSPRIKHEVRRNVYVLTAENPHASYKEGIAYITPDGARKMLMPAYTRGNKMVFLLPLRRYEYPVRIVDRIGKINLEPQFQEEIFPYKNNLVELDELELYFPYESVFRNLHLEVTQKPGTSKMYSDIFEVGNSQVAVFKSYLVSFVPNQPVDRNHLIVAKREKGKWKYAGNTLGEENNVYTAVREFGEFCLMADTVQPTIVPINFSPGKSLSSGQKTLRIKINDSFSGVDSDRIYCTFDGEWAMFGYNFKTKQMTHEFKEKPEKGQHILEVNVYDKANNHQQKRYQLTFY